LGGLEAEQSRGNHGTIMGSYHQKGNGTDNAASLNANDGGGALGASALNYRRLCEAAKNGILMPTGS